MNVLVAQHAATQAKHNVKCVVCVARLGMHDVRMQRIEADLQQAGIENQATGNDRADSLKEGMAAAKAAREAAQAALAAARAAAAEREAAADTARAAAGKARAAAADQQDQADSLGAELARAQRARTSPAQHWGGEPAARLKALVDRQWQQRKFSRKPVGPLGCHLRLVDGLWAKAVVRKLEEECGKLVQRVAREGCGLAVAGLTGTSFCICCCWLPSIHVCVLDATCGIPEECVPYMRIVAVVKQ